MDKKGRSKLRRVVHHALSLALGYTLGSWLRVVQSEVSPTEVLVLVVIVICLIVNTALLVESECNA